MRLGDIYVWGKGTASVSDVTLIYDGNTLKPSFTQEADKEVSDIWMCLTEACRCKTSA